MEAVTELTPKLEGHRAELLGYCYRMLGSAFEAEDAVQETLVRAWRHQHRFDDARAPLRSWLYSIATSVCLDMLRSSQRRARPMDLSPAAAGPSLGPPLPEAAFVQPIPDSWVVHATSDPAELAAQRESSRWFRCCTRTRPSRCHRSPGGCVAATRFAPPCWPPGSPARAGA